IVVSAKVRLRSANIFAVFSRSVWRAVACPAAISFQVFQIGGAQNLATVVWSAVRVVLVSRPRLCTSLMAVAQAVLFSAGGGGGRNWSPLFRTNGVVVPQW